MSSTAQAKREQHPAVTTAKAVAAQPEPKPMPARGADPITDMKAAMPPAEWFALQDAMPPEYWAKIQVFGPPKLTADPHEQLGNAGNVLYWVNYVLTRVAPVKGNVNIDKLKTAATAARIWIHVFEEIINAKDK